MTNSTSLFEWKGYLVTFVSLIFSLILFYSYTYDLFYSLFGAALSAGLVWGGYLVIRMIILAVRDKK